LSLAGQRLWTDLGGEFRPKPLVADGFASAYIWRRAISPNVIMQVLLLHFKISLNIYLLNVDYKIRCDIKTFVCEELDVQRELIK
jgi:hypothetical protein